MSTAHAESAAQRWGRAIDVLQRAGDYSHVPLLEAAKVGLIDLVFISSRFESLAFGRIRKSVRPVILVVGDDDDTPTGPDGWRCARQITQWAAGAIVHGAGAQREHYELAVQGALVCRRFLVVDTSSAHAYAWTRLLGHVQALVIVPKDGPHPLEQRETVH